MLTLRHQLSLRWPSPHSCMLVQLVSYPDSVSCLFENIIKNFDASNLLFFIRSYDEFWQRLPASFPGATILWIFLYTGVKISRALKINTWRACRASRFWDNNNTVISPISKKKKKERKKKKKRKENLSLKNITLRAQMTIGNFFLF